jgi:hypothetical protein
MVEIVACENGWGSDRRRGQTGSDGVRRGGIWPLLPRRWEGANFLLRCRWEGANLLLPHH